MVCINRRKQHSVPHSWKNGGGVIDSIMNKFTSQRYPGEHHAYSLAPATFGTPMNFMGPGTDLSRRLNPDETPKADSQFVNSSDFQSYKHDLAYKHAKDDYLKNPTPENKKKQMKRVWEADDKFIGAMNRDHEEPMAPIAGKLIRLKETAEKLGAPTTFSGFGVAEEEEIIDPCQKLRDLVKSEYKTEKKGKKKLQKGGILPALIPIAIAIGSALAGKITNDVYDFVKKKVTGGGHKMPNHKTKKEKVEFLKDFINNIE